MEPILFRYRARDLTINDIAQIQAAIVSHYARGRGFIARTLCERWDWRQPNGGYKEFAARDLLLRLEEAGLIELPARKRVKSNVSKQTYARIPLYKHEPLDLLQLNRKGEQDTCRLRKSWAWPTMLLRCHADLFQQRAAAHARIL